MNRDISFQEWDSNMLATASTPRNIKNRKDEDRIMRLCEPRSIGLDECPQDFDLVCENYQNAVDCIIQCEFVIKSLQEQLVMKDEQISRLEDKIIQTSFELASAKALQDEQAQQLNQCKRRLENGNASASSSIVSDDDEEHCRQDIARKYTPISCAKGNISDQKHFDHSSSSIASIYEDTMPSFELDTSAWSSHDDVDNENEGVDIRHPEPKRRGGFRLSLLAPRMSWSIDDSMTSRSAFDDINEKESISGNEFNNSFKENQFPIRNNSSGVNASNAAKKSHMFSQLLRFSKNEDMNSEEFDKQEYNEEVASSGHRQQKRNSLSEMSAVIFPVSSEDCLVGLVSRSKDANTSTENSFRNNHESAPRRCSGVYWE